MVASRSPGSGVGVPVLALLLAAGVSFFIHGQRVTDRAVSDPRLAPWPDERGLWGYKNRGGLLVIPPTFFRALSFSEGLAAVSWSEDGGFGYVDALGGTRVPARFLAAGPFVEGRAIVSSRTEWGERYGVIDERGEWVVEPMYDSISPFVHGVAEAWEAGYGFVNADGAMTIAPRFDRVGTFNDGIAPVEVDGRWGYIDARGRYRTTPRFAFAEEFRGGYGRVLCDDADSEFGFVDVSGQLVSPCVWAYRPFVPFLDGVAFGERVVDANGGGKLELISPRDVTLAGDRLVARTSDRGYLLEFFRERDRVTEVVGKEFAWLHFCDGGDVVAGKRDGDVLVDRDGRLIITASLGRHLECFSEGRASFSLGEGSAARHGFLDRSGAVVVEPIYVSVGPFSEGLAAACVLQREPADDKGDPDAICGYIDAEGTIAVPFRLLSFGYSAAQFFGPFRDGVAAARRLVGDRAFVDSFIDRSGRWLARGSAEPAGGERLEPRLVGGIVQLHRDGQVLQRESYDCEALARVEFRPEDEDDRAWVAGLGCDRALQARR